MDLGKSALKALKPVLVAAMLAAGAAFADPAFATQVQGMNPKLLLLLPLAQWFVGALMDAYKHRADTVVTTTITTPLSEPVAPGLPNATVISTFTTPVDPKTVLPTAPLTDPDED